MSAVIGSPLWEEAVTLVPQSQPMLPTGDDAERFLNLVIELGNTTKMSTPAVLAEIDRRVQERSAP